MAKRKKTQEQRNVAQLESDREWLVRTTLIGMGYVKHALEATTDPVASKVYATHLAEMELAIEGCRPAAEDVLKRLATRVSDIGPALDVWKEAVSVLRADNWLIWSNEHAAWWKPAELGYTTEIAQAGRYTFAKAWHIANPDPPRTCANHLPDEMIHPSPEWIEERERVLALAVKR